MTNPEIQRHYKFNFAVGSLDGSFFGFALGLASYVTILPLFVSNLTDSTILIGLIATIHTLGWQVPQLFTSNRVSRLTQIKPMVIWMTIHERLPYLGLALIAFLLPNMNTNLALFWVIVLLSWQSFGGGFTATAWQSMISKVIPLKRRGTFYGFQSSAANLMGSIGAVLAGLILSAMVFPMNFALIFFIAGISMLVSMAFLMMTREPDTPVEASPVETQHRDFRTKLGKILKADENFRWFLLARIFSQFAGMAVAFYTIYAVRIHQMSPEVAGTMTAILFISQTASSSVIGWMGDTFGHRVVFAGGNILMAFSAGIALFAPSLGWFYLVFALTGIVNSTSWTSVMALTAEFGSESERPLYIGMANTLISPATLLAPILGGWVADTLGFNVTFAISVFCGLATALLLFSMMNDPIKQKQKSILLTSDSTG